MFDQSLLPTVLRHDEIAFFDGKSIRVLDRRCYPLKKEYISVKSAEDAYWAIKDMAVQGGAPLELALRTMLLSYEKKEDLEKCASLLSSARPTNKSMANTLSDLLKRISSGTGIYDAVDSILDEYDEAYDRMSSYGKDLIEDGDGILTTCFAEHSFLLSLAKARMEGKDIRVYVPETRPYLQGAKLTLPSLNEMGIESYLITDAMPAFFMREGKIMKYMSASDALLPDFSVANKIGTLSNAICARYYGIPYYPFSLESSSNSNLEIEYRSGNEVLSINGCCITEPGAKALYPAFDIIERSLISGIITKNGIIYPNEFEK